MLTIILGKNIEWSKEDTFEMPVSHDAGFEDGTQLRFDISENENSEPLISNKYSLTNGEFNVVLQKNDRDKLNVGGNYIYRIIIMQSDGTITTEQSGYFDVKWGV